MLFPRAFLFLAILVREMGFQVHAHQISHHAHRPRSILHVHDGLPVRGSDFHGRVRAAGRGAADQQGNGETFALHFFRDVHHFFERRRDQAAQADQVRVGFARGLQNFVARHHHAEVNHFVIVAAQHDADDVLADIVNVALHGGHDDAPLDERARRWPVFPLPDTAADRPRLFSSRERS